MRGDKGRQKARGQRPDDLPGLKQSLGRRILLRRAGLGMPTSELGRRVGVSLVLIRRWERGLGLPSVQTLCRLARALGVTADWLLAGPDQRRAA